MDALDRLVTRAAWVGCLLGAVYLITQVGAVALRAH